MIGEMAQQVGAPATKPDNLRLILEIHKMEGERQSPKVVLWAPLWYIGMFVLMHVCARTHAHTNNEENKIMNTNSEKKYTKPDPL